MKKSLFFAFALAGGLLCSCSSDDAIIADGGGINGENPDGLVPIQLGVSNNAVTGVRGTGTVGGVVDNSGELMEGETNNWQGDTVYVYMLEKGTVKPAMFNKNVIYYNQSLKTPSNASTGLAEFFDGSIKYYPSVGNYDFWAYHIDKDAITSVEAPYDENGELVGNETDDIVVNFKMDGSQDIMTAKAELTDEQIAITEGAGMSARPDAYYSAFSARNEIQPYLTFKHQLTRLTFSVKAGEEGAALPATYDPENPDLVKNTGVRVDGISVVSRNEGRLTVAYSGDAVEGKQLISFDNDTDESDDILSLKKRTVNGGLDYLETLTEVTPNWDSNFDKDNQKAIRVGEALLVEPGKTEYTLIMRTKQNVQTSVEINDDGTMTDVPVYEDVSYVYENLKIKLPDGSAFLPGYSYNVMITVFGYQKIEITTTLEPWKWGEDIPIIPENEILY